MSCQVAGHRVNRVSEILPRTCNSGHICLSPQSAFGADFAGYARDFTSEAVQLIDHRVQSFFKLQNLAPHIDCNFAREIAAGNRGRHFGDIAHLSRQVAGHEVHVVGEVLPGSAYTGHLRLSAQLAFGAYFASDASYLTSKSVELIYHRVNSVFELEDFALDVYGNLS